MEKLAVYSQKTARSGCARLASVNWLLSGLRRRCTAINHRTIRWCSGLSGEPTVGRVIRARRVAEPTVRRGTGLSGVHRTLRCANGSESPTVGIAKEGKKSAPDSVRWCTGLSGAPGDRRQELPSWNALNGCLGAIKGTPRRIEEYTKHSVSIPKHQDFNSAHSIPCDSN
jgi:hypothetical protein